MRSRWNEDEAAALSELDLLTYASRLIGAETSLVVWGGGNTSIKVTERDHRGRTAHVLRVKGSGSDLKSIQRKDFPGVRMDDIRALLERDDMGDQEMVDYLARALQEPGGPRRIELATRDTPELLKKELARVAEERAQKAEQAASSPSSHQESSGLFSKVKSIFRRG